jgi:hypothetical protein
VSPTAAPKGYSNNSAAAQEGLGLFKVHYTDDATEPVVVRATSRAVVECERRWPGRMLDNSDRYPPNEGVHYMVWVSMGKPSGDFEQWLDAVLSLEVVEAITIPPTKRGRGAG